MARVSLTKVITRNFRSLLGEQIFDLKTGLVSVSGKNLDTGGESGAGKSAFLHAIAYAFGFAPYSAKALQCWFTEEPMSVEVHMATSEGPAVLERGERLALTINGIRTTGAAKAVEAELDRLTGLNARLRAALTYRGQKKPGLFLAMKDSEKKDFFVDVLGLHWAEDAIERSGKSIAEWAREVDRQTAAVEAATKALGFVRDQMPVVTRHDTSELKRELSRQQSLATSCDARLLDARKQYAAIEGTQRALREEAAFRTKERVSAVEAHIRELQAQMPKLHGAALREQEALLSECCERLDAAWRLDHERKQKEETELRRKQDEYAALIVKHSRLKQVEKEFITTEHQLRAVVRECCPTCDKPWDRAAAEVVRLNQRCLELETERLELIELQRPIDRLAEHIRSYEFVPSDSVTRLLSIRESIRLRVREEETKLSSENSLARLTLDVEVSKLKGEIALIQQQAAEESSERSRESQGLLAAASAQIQILIADANVAESSAKLIASKLSHLERENETAETLLRKHKEVLGTAEAELDEKRVALAVAEGNLHAEQDFLVLVRGFLNQIFDEILAEITDETNSTLGTLPNVAHLTIRFVSDYQTQKGTTKQAIVPIASFNGEDHPIDSGCSGGMETSVELAIDLAVAQVVARRTGSDLRWLILDESFNGHDQVTKEACLEVLARYAQDRLVLVVDHASEMKEMFSQKIQIEFQNGRSRVTE